MDPALLEMRINAVGGPLLGALLLYAVIELIALHFRWRKLRLREARMSMLGVLSGGALAALVARAVGVLSVAIAAAAGASLSPIEASLEPPW